MVDIQKEFTQDTKKKSMAFYENIYLLLVPASLCIILYLVETSGNVNYLIKSALKLLLFLPAPLVFKALFGWKALHDKGKTLFFKQVKTGLILGSVFFTVLLSVYFILRQYIDLNAISENLKQSLKVTPSNFIFVAAYITFGNSFVEEYFFRGVIFLKLYENGCRITAYVFSSILFSLYHIMMFKDWFTLPIFLLSIAGLAGVGFIFDFMDLKYKTIYNSWISHILADSAIMLIGFKMFGLI